MGRIGEALYLLIGLIAVALGVAHLRRPEWVSSPLAALRWLQRRSAGRWAVLLAWWWLGWHLFVR
jgi:Family of unknown function (DUF6186)